MKIVENISLAELKDMASKMDGNIVKADIDIARKIVIIDMPMHFEGEQELLEQGSKQSDLWGINLLPAQFGTEGFIAYESMINLKPRQNNSSMSIELPEVREQIRDIIHEVVYE